MVLLVAQNSLIIQINALFMPALSKLFNNLFNGGEK